MKNNIIEELSCSFHHCFDAVGWAAGKAPGLLKTEW